MVRIFSVVKVQQIRYQQIRYHEKPKLDHGSILRKVSCKHKRTFINLFRALSCNTERKESLNCVILSVVNVQQIRYHPHQIRYQQNQG